MSGTAIFSLAKYCIDEDKAGDGEEQMARMRHIQSVISNAKYNAPTFSSQSSGEQWLPANKTERGSGNLETGSAKTPHSASRAVDVSNTRATWLGSPKSFNAETMNMEFGLSSSVMLGSGKKAISSRINEDLKNLFMTNRGILSTGSRGVVLKGVLNGQEVAVKMWSREIGSGMKALCREIEIYKKLQAKCPFVLGFALPKMLLGWDEPRHNSVYKDMVILITAYIGEEIVDILRESCGLLQRNATRKSMFSRNR